MANKKLLVLSTEYFDFTEDTAFQNFKLKLCNAGPGAAHFIRKTFKEGLLVEETLFVLQPEKHHYLNTEETSGLICVTYGSKESDVMIFAQKVESEAWYKEMKESLQEADMPEEILALIIEYCPYYSALRSLVKKWHSEKNHKCKKLYFSFLEDAVDLIDEAEERHCEM